MGEFMLTNKDKYEVKTWCLLEKSATLKAEHGHIEIAHMLERWATRKHDRYLKEN